MKKQKTLSQIKTQQLFEPYLFIAPTIILFVFVLAIPLFNLFKYSLGDSNIIQGFKEWNSFENFKYLINPKFLSSLFVTFKYVFAGVLGIAVFGMIMSLTLNKPIKGRALFRTVAIIPWVVPHAFAAAMWSWVVNAQFGFINQFLLKLSVINEPISFLNVDTALTTVIIVRIWQGTPFMIISLLAALQTIPKDIIEASLIDGCTGINQFINITFPSIKKVFITTLLIITAWTMQIFDTVYIMTGGGPIRSTQLVAIEIYMSAFQNDNLGQASAMAIVILIIVTLLSLANQKGKED